MMATEVKGGRSITWLVSGFALTVLLVSLACVGATFTFVFGWWAPGLAAVVAVGVVALAIRRFPRDSPSRTR